jgi:hypothetical protein
MSATVYEPVDVVDAPGITIAEYFGNVASKDSKLSACVVTVRKPSEEAYQTPEFDEYVLVLEGEVELLQGDGKRVTIAAGNGAFLPKGLRVKWIWKGACKYVPICLPAFTPENCGREEEEGNHLAKTSAAMDKLRDLHKNNSSADGGLSRDTLLGFGTGIVAGVALAMFALRNQKQ